MHQQVELIKLETKRIYLFQGDFRNTPITLGSANTPQPHLQQQQQQQQQQQNESIFEDVVEEMTPTEAENLLSDKLVEKRSVYKRDQILCYSLSSAVTFTNCSLWLVLSFKSFL